jgi:hypothetical protein
MRTNPSCPRAAWKVPNPYVMPFGSKSPGGALPRYPGACG